MDSEPFSFNLKFETLSDCLILTPAEPEITYKNSKLFLLESKNQISRDSCMAIIDMRHIHIIDSLSLGTLVAIMKYARSFGGDVFICNVSSGILDLFSLLSFNKVFRIFQTLDEAVEAAGSSSDSQV